MVAVGPVFMRAGGRLNLATLGLRVACEVGVYACETGPKTCEVRLPVKLFHSFEHEVPPAISGDLSGLDEQLVTEPAAATARQRRDVFEPHQLGEMQPQARLGPMDGLAQLASRPLDRLRLLFIFRPGPLGDVSAEEAKQFTAGGGQLIKRLAELGLLCRDTLLLQRQVANAKLLLQLLFFMLLRSCKKPRNKQTSRKCDIDATTSTAHTDKSRVIWPPAVLQPHVSHAHLVACVQGVHVRVAR